MKRTAPLPLITRCLLVIVLSAAVVPPAAGSAEISAREIMEKNFFVIKPKTITSRASMTLIAGTGGIRGRTMTISGKLQRNGLDSKLVIRFLLPADIQGTAFLQIEQSEGDDNLWIYLPALRKSRRLVANNKKDSFFGSDFSYGDILPPNPNRYEHVLIRSEDIDGQAYYVVESKPKSETEKRNCGYSRKITWVRTDNFLESKVEYYDSEGRLLKTQRLTEHTELDRENRKWIAARREMNDHLTGHRTIWALDDIQVNKPIADDYFTVRTIERE